jgi:hypothetical protein
MIEIARAIDPFERANDVLASREAWVVVERATGKQLIACRIRPARETAGKGKDDTLMVRVDVDRRYHDLCWIKEGGRLVHKRSWTSQVVGERSRYWAIVQRLWGHLIEGRIPSSVQIWPDEAFERERLAAFEAAYPDVWRELITLSGYRKFNENKLELVRKFGRLTDKEIASIRERGRNRPKAQKAANETKPLPLPKRDFDIDDDIH